MRISSVFLVLISIAAVSPAAVVGKNVGSTAPAWQAGSTDQGRGQGSMKSQSHADDFVSAHFAGSGKCAPCHDGLRDQDGNDVSLVKSWGQSLMAFSFIDPLWQAKVASEVARNPGLQEVIEKKCVRCHAPMASTEALFAGATVKLFGDDGFLDPASPYHALALEGVSCTLCHQIAASEDLGTDDGISGQFIIGDYANPYERPLYGQFGDLFEKSMLRSVRFLPTFSDHIHESRVCAACHDLKTPYVDAEGQVVSTPATEFPEQMPYREWDNSYYSETGSTPKSCHECHLLHAPGVPLAKAPGWLAERQNFSQHTFFTENTLILRILDSYAEELGVSVSLQAALDGSRTYLQESGSIEITAASLDDSGLLEVAVKVTNNTGHKLPTSIPIRRVFIHFRVLDAAGEVAFESGKINEDGSIKGVDADSNPAAYEPHYQVIDSDNQVQVYEGIMANTDGEVTYTLLRAASFKKDNRIPPAGFVKTAVPPEVRPVGNCQEDEDFVGGSDQVLYRVAGLDGGSYTVEAELFDQTLSYRFAEDLFADNNEYYVQRFQDMYLAEGNASESIDRVSVVVNR